MDIAVRQIIVFVVCFLSPTQSMFSQLENLDFDSSRRTSGLAVVDVDFDGIPEVIVAVLDGPNSVLKYDNQTSTYINIAEIGSPFQGLRDEKGKTISVCGCDIDGDGREEIYLHNINLVYGPDADRVVDKLLTWRGGEYVDLFSDLHNLGLAPSYGGNSVACVDIRGEGTFSVLVATFGKDGRGKYQLLAMNSSDPANNVKDGFVVVGDFTKVTGLDVERDGRGIAVGPVLSDNGLSDIYVTNEHSYHVGSSVFRHSGKNCFFRNNGNGTFTNMADILGLEDQDENGRSAVFGKFGGNNDIDIMYLNWLGPNRMFINNLTLNDDYYFQNDAGRKFSMPGPASVMVVGDFNNDGESEVMVAAADADSFYPTENRLLRIIPKSVDNASIELTPPSLRQLYITGMVATDMNSDGLLELIVTHKLTDEKTVRIFQSSQGTTHNWVRFFPKTRAGAPARGSKVMITLDDDKSDQQIIGGGCGFMCQSEPAAHFGTGKTFAREVTVLWADGHLIRKFMYPRDINKSFSISYAGTMTELDSSTNITGSNLASAAIISSDPSFYIALIYILLPVYFR